MSSIFLSHNHGDKPFVRRLARDLRKLGARVWVDEAEIKIGDSLIEKIQQGLSDMQYVGAVLSPRSVDSPWVTRELDIASNLEIAGRRVRVLPLIIEKCQVPLFLTGKLFADFTRPQNYRAELSKLVDRLGLERPATPVRPDVLWTWYATALQRGDSGLFRRVLDGLLDILDVDRERFRDVVGRSREWPADFREVAAEEALHAMSMEGERGLAAVFFLKYWGIASDGEPLPAAIVEAVNDDALPRRVGANMYAHFAGAPHNWMGETVCDRSQPLHLRIADLYVSPWADLNELGTGIGAESLTMQTEFVEALRNPSAGSLVFHAKQCVLDQVSDLYLRVLIAACVKDEVPRLLRWAQLEHAGLLSKALETEEAWHPRSLPMPYAATARQEIRPLSRSIEPSR